MCKDQLCMSHVEKNLGAICAWQLKLEGFGELQVTAIMQRAQEGTG